MKRDPRINPMECDVLYQAGGNKELHVDRVTDREVAYRVTDSHGGLLGAYRTPLLVWRGSALYCCDEWYGK
jgi:hypothetical protein